MKMNARSFKRKRTGILAEKIGMSYVYDKEGKRIAATVLQMHSTDVLAVKTVAKNGYDAIVLATKDAKVKRVNKPQLVEFAKANVEPKRHVQEFRVSADALVAQGEKITAEHFVVDQFIDVSGQTIGKGFAGVMKRHNFRGLEASHGVSVSHRSHGSTGQRQDPGRVFKNKKMAGHMGDVKVTVQNLQILKVDQERQLLFVKGAVPGSKGEFVEVNDAVKRAIPPSAPYPAALLSAKNAAPAPEPVVEENTNPEQNSGE